MVLKNPEVRSTINQIFTEDPGALTDNCIETSQITLQKVESEFSKTRSG